MQENPYASPETPVAAEPEIVPAETVPVIADDNPYLRPLFACRKWSMVGFGAALFLGFAADRILYTNLSLGLSVPTDLIRFVSSSVMLLMIASVLVFVAATVGCWFYLFLAGRRHAGVIYALFHLLSSIVLTPVFLFGIILMPVLVRGDVERAYEASGVSEQGE